MKPLKGMNQDITAANMPENTYKKAQHFVFGKELDALMQEPGLRQIGNNTEKNAVLGVVALSENNLLLFTYDLEALDGAGSAIRLYNFNTESYSIILQDNELNFLPDTVISAAVFRNKSNEEQVVYTDGFNPLRIINIDSPNINMATNKLFPDYKSVQVLGEAAVGAGAFASGSHFFSIAYEQEDGSRTAFQQLVGPYVLKEGSGTFNLTLNNLDLNFKYVLIASVSFVNSAILTYVQRRVAIIENTLSIEVSNVNNYMESSLEEIVGGTAVYTQARTLTIHDNRLYLANLEEHSEENLARYAHSVQPMWVYGETSPEGSAPYTAVFKEEAYPKSMTFMPDEVYAFYISYIREDGSETSAFHIPGEWESMFPVETSVNDTTLSQSMDSTIDEVLDNALVAYPSTNPNVDYLNNDKRIIGGDGKIFRTRVTAKEDAQFGASQDGRKRGKFGIWKNKDEFYDAEMEPYEQRRYHLQANGSLAITTYALASGGVGKEVRHHKFPSLNWLMKQWPNEPEFATLNLSSPKILKVEFDHVIIPKGYTAARVHFAKRTVTNSTVMGQSPVQHGYINTYAYEASGNINGSARNYASTMGTNCQMLNWYDGNIQNNYGTTIQITAVPSPNNWEEMVQLGVGRMHPMEMLGYKPRVSGKLGHHFIKTEYFIHTPLADFQSSESSYHENQYYWRIVLDPDSDFELNTLLGNGVYESQQYRNRVMHFDHVAEGTVSTVSANNEVKSIQNSRYVAAGVIVTDEKIDNRGAEECLHFEIDHDWEGSNLGPGDTYGWDKWKVKLKNGTDVNGQTVDKGFWLDDLRAYGNPGNGLDQVDTPPSEGFAMSNFCTARSNVYQSYKNQELVSAGTMTTIGLISPCAIGDDMADAEALRVKIQAIYNGSTVGKITYNEVAGDTIYGQQRYRTTAQVGWVTRHRQNPATENGVSSFVPDSFSSGTSGTVRVGRNVALYSAINPELSDTDQSKLGEWTFLASQDRTNAPDQTNDFTYNKSFLKLNDWRQPIIYDPTANYISTLPFRVARSSMMTADTDELNFKTFPPLDTYEQTRKRGSIVNVESFLDKILIHHERGLFATSGKEKLATTAGEIAFGSGDVFATTPQEVVPSPLGFAGTQHQPSCLLTPSGYFFVDESQGKVFSYTGKVKEISQVGMQEFFRKRLDLNKIYKNIEAINSFYPGISTSYDPKLRRVVFHYRNFTTTGDTSISGAAYNQNNTEFSGHSYFEDREGREIKDFIVSYSPDRDSWISFHDYNSTILVGGRDEYFTIDSSTGSSRKAQIFLHNDFTADVSKFIGYSAGGVTRPSYIDLSFPFGDAAVLKSFSWLTKVREGALETENFIEHDSTFTHALVHNDYQASGNISLIRADGDMNGVPGTTTLGTNNLRRVNHSWTFNEFRDLVLDRTLRFIDSEGEIVDTNIDVTKPWFDQKRFISNHVTIRLTAENSSSTTKALYLYDVAANARKSYR
jgi:hypothetical protein